MKDAFFAFVFFLGPILVLLGLYDWFRRSGRHAAADYLTLIGIVLFLILLGVMVTDGSPPGEPSWPNH